MPGRKFSAGNGYRYGFNGKEDDKDAGEGIQDYGMRIYDGRLGRFLSVDPLSKDYPWNSTYAFAENDVIRSIDLDGLEKLIANEYYDKNNELTKTVFTGIRNSETKAAVNMNMKSALGVKLTTQDVYVIKRNSKGKIFSEYPAGKLDKYYKSIVSKASIVKGDNDNSLPDNTMQQSESTTRGNFYKSALISNVENEFFEKTFKNTSLNTKVPTQITAGGVWLAGNGGVPDADNGVLSSDMKTGLDAMVSRLNSSTNVTSAQVTMMYNIGQSSNQAQVDREVSQLKTTQANVVQYLQKRVKKSITISAGSAQIILQDNTGKPDPSRGTFLNLKQ